MSWCDETQRVFSHIRERDIDLLLVEEFRCCAVFREWFFSRLGEFFSGCPSTGCVLHSVTETGPGTGETDIQLTVGDCPNAVRLYIENKIDAPFSDRTSEGRRQVERYRARGQEAVKRCECTQFACILLAPRDYISDDMRNWFDHVITYEDLIAFFDSRADDPNTELALRARHRRALIRAALERWRRGWSPKPVAEVTNLWTYYYRVASSHYPQLKMRAPGLKPADSYTVSFPCLPLVKALPRCFLEHVMETGNVFFRVPNAAHRMEEVLGKIEQHLDPDMTLRKAGKSLAVNISVPRIDRARSGELQHQDIEKALQAAARLKAWFEENASLLQ